MKVSEIDANIIAQLQISLGQQIPIFPKSFIRVLARVLAGVFVILNKYADYICLQLFVATASMAETEILGNRISPLKEWGRMIGAGDPYAATAASATVRVLVIAAGGDPIPAGTQLVNPLTQLIYITKTTLFLGVPGAYTLNVDCTTLGTIGAVAVGAKLSFLTPPVQVYSETDVTVSLGAGTDAETEGAYRKRITDYFQRRPQGGAAADYYLWGMTVAGVRNIYPYTGAVPGTVDVYVEGTGEDRYPSINALAGVSMAVGSTLRKPINAQPIIKPITIQDFTVSVSLTEDGLRPEITDAIENYFLDREPFLEGVSSGIRRDRVYVNSLSGIVQDICDLYGASFGRVVMRRNGSSTAVYALAEGELVRCLAVSYA